ncbi:MAG: hypothetical protein AMXMBFR59_36670 [Rhodanobacteraceae bacterium]
MPRPPPDHLLVPMMPTPNGPLHLGHAAGPYLRMDVLARHLRQSGGRVALVTSTDSFESHVLQSATRHGETPAQTCQFYRDAIARDFAFLRIDFDAFVEPSASAASSGYRLAHAHLVDTLHANGAARFRSEACLVDADTGAAVPGFLLSGHCPACGAATVGHVCEQCGLQMTADMLHAPRALDGRRLRWAEAMTLALDGAADPSLPVRIDAMNLPSEFRAAIRAFVTDPRNLVRLSVTGGYGVGPHHVGGRDICLYNSYFGHALYWAQWWQARHGGLPPFSRDSPVVTVTSCGLDNATDLGASLLCAAGSGRRSFDHCLVNFFLTLDGAKFSTGANHAIFVGDVAARGAVAADGLRYRLATLSPERSTRDFRVDDFVACYNDDFIDRLAGCGDAVLQRATAVPANDVAHTRWDDAMRARAHALAPDQFSLPAYAAIVRDYAAHAPDGGAGAASWLRGLSVLAWPLLPTLCERWWRALGFPETPCVPIAWSDRPAVAIESVRHGVAPITAADVPRTRP